MNEPSLANGLAWILYDLARAIFSFFFWRLFRFLATFASACCCLDKSRAWNSLFSSLCKNEIDGVNAQRRNIYEKGNLGACAWRALFHVPHTCLCSLSIFLRRSISLRRCARYT